MMLGRWAMIFGRGWLAMRGRTLPSLILFSTFISSLISFMFVSLFIFFLMPLIGKFARMFPLVGSFSFFFGRASPPEVLVLSVFIFPVIFVRFRHVSITVLMIMVVGSLVPVVVLWIWPRPWSRSFVPLLMLVAFGVPVAMVPGRGTAATMAFSVVVAPLLKLGGHKLN